MATTLYMRRALEACVLWLGYYLPDYAVRRALG